MMKIDNKNFAFLLLFCIIFIKEANSQCAPNCTSSAVGLKVENPENCHQFYYCLDNTGTLVPSDTPYECPPGTYFEISGADCVTEVTTCTSNCVPNPEICNTVVCSDSNTDKTYADATDCNKYYFCSLQNEPVEVLCESPDIYFNGEACVPDENQCCTTALCSPYCSSGTQFTNTPDPCDCFSFYFCEENNSVPLYPSTCSSGEFFNATAAVCDTGTTCDNMCDPLQCDALTNLSKHFYQPRFYN